MSSEVAKGKQKFSVAIQSDGYKKLINNTLGNPKKAERFVASIISAISVNSDLQDCDAGSILSSALLGESLNLSPSPKLGQYYLIPFNDKKKGKVANFILGYKGYLQLAIRSGYYKKINVVAIKEGELVNFNPLEEEVEVNLIEDEETREKATTIGYYAMFEYLNGFRKAMYWSKPKMVTHAQKYSPGYKKDLDNGWSYTFWTKDFDAMAFKTMLRQLISKWGIMSIDLQTAFEADIESENRRNIDVVDNEVQDEISENANKKIIDFNSSAVVDVPVIETEDESSINNKKEQSTINEMIDPGF
nr:recombinase RecT [Sedimentibacter sp.]